MLKWYQSFKALFPLKGKGHDNDDEYQSYFNDFSLKKNIRNTKILNTLAKI